MKTKERRLWRIKNKILPTNNSLREGKESAIINERGIGTVLIGLIWFKSTLVIGKQPV